MVAYNRFHFSEHFEVHSKIEWRVQRFPIYLLPSNIYLLPHYQHIPPEYICYTDESTLSHHYYPEYIVYTGIHSWYGTFCRFRHTYNDMYTPLWFPRWLSVKELAYQADDMGSTSGSGRSPGEGNGSTLQYSGLGNPMDRGAWHTWGHKYLGSQRVRHNLATKKQQEQHTPLYY